MINDYTYNILLSNIKDLICIIKNNFKEINKKNFKKKTTKLKKEIRKYNNELFLDFIKLENDVIQIKIDDKKNKKYLGYEFSIIEEFEDKIYFIYETKDFTFSIENQGVENIHLNYFIGDTYNNIFKNLNIHLTKDLKNNITKIKRIRSLKKEENLFEFLGEKSLSFKQKETMDFLTTLIIENNIDLFKIALEKESYIKEIKELIDSQMLLNDDNLMEKFIFETNIVGIIKEKDLSMKKEKNKKNILDNIYFLIRGLIKNKKTYQ